MPKCLVKLHITFIFKIMMLVLRSLGQKCELLFSILVQEMSVSRIVMWTPLKPKQQTDDLGVRRNNPPLLVLGGRRWSACGVLRRRVFATRVRSWRIWDTGRTLTLQPVQQIYSLERTGYFSVQKRHSQKRH